MANVAKIGDKVTACGHTYTIAKILFQGYWDRYGWDIEFIDSKGNYHHWKQEQDGGNLEKKGEAT